MWSVYTKKTARSVNRYFVLQSIEELLLCFDDVIALLVEGSSDFVHVDSGELVCFVSEKNAGSDQQQRVILENAVLQEKTLHI